MEIVIVQLFVSLGLVTAAILLFAHSVKQENAENAEHLSLLPIEDERHEGPVK